MRQREREDRLNAFFNTLTDELTSSLGVFPKARDRLVQRMRKRARFVNKELEPLAIQAFLETNRKVGLVELGLPGQIVADAKHFITVMLERFSTTLSELNIQETLDLSYLMSNWRFGPNTSNGVRGTHTAGKIDQNMTCTALCEPYVRLLRASNVYFSANDGANGDFGVTPIYGSKLSTVPKNEDTVRTIATEPSGNMAMQLAAGHYLEGVLSYIGCDISCQQPLNKALACRGSIDGSVCTIDLKSASDMISIPLVRALMPKKWFDFLMKIRSPSASIGGQQVELSMISTMGDGFTFPLMTLILVSLIYANRCSRGGPNLYIDWSSTAVFGDDIIVPTDEYESLCELLAQAGLLVNHQKSYSVGTFRESCGGDYDEGVDITPFYVKSLATDSEIYVALNQLLTWSARHNLWPLRSYRLLLSYLRNGPFFIPEWLGPEQGIQTAKVPRRYKFLELYSSKKPYKGFFSMMLACGGYLEGAASGLFYTPRPDKVRARTRSARLPRGFLDGADPVSRSVALSGRIVMIIAMAG